MPKPFKWLIFLAFTVQINLLLSQAEFVSVPGHDHMVVQQNVMIPMSDGIKLATDIYYPAKNGKPDNEKLPVLLQRTPYGKTGARYISAVSLFTQKGYIVAVQDLRGRYNSEGEFTKYNPLEASDGATSVEWLSKLKSTNG